MSREKYDQTKITWWSSFKDGKILEYCNNSNENRVRDDVDNHFFDFHKRVLSDFVLTVLVNLSTVYTVQWSSENR